ncbi:hypothetical protein RRG08_029064 [Elysia crispata]|uniref:Uncharacterized protein n=1 Tax=Elysia crispata TaxID=231223 RepID=A0AAE0ZK82_9GAST|nr:hypothetical protein RRG08_029064 [Elysia crispata]
MGRRIRCRLDQAAKLSGCKRCGLPVSLQRITMRSSDFPESDLDLSDQSITFRAVCMAVSYQPLAPRIQLDKWDERTGLLNHCE